MPVLQVPALLKGMQDILDALCERAAKLVLKCVFFEVLMLSLSSLADFREADYENLFVRLDHFPDVWKEKQV